jgi:hypothetical protein
MQNLNDYVLRLPNHIDNHLADETLTYLEDPRTVWEEHVFYNNREGEYYSNGEDCFYSRSILPNQQQLMKRVWHSIEEYVVKAHKSDYFNGWEGFTQVEFHRYHPTSKMLKHCDHIHSIFDGTVKGIPILTVLGVLNDGYTGGEFSMFEDTVIPFEKGDVIVFPSCFLYPHEVKQLTEGVRYSFVSWVY